MCRNLVGFLLLSVLIISSTDCAKRSTNKTIQQQLNIEKNYILIPVQDRADELKFTIHYPDASEPEILWIRLAQQQIDYWVKIDVSKFINQPVSIEIENANRAS